MALKNFASNIVYVLTKLLYDILFELFPRVHFKAHNTLSLMKDYLFFGLFDDLLKLLSFNYFYCSVFHQFRQAKFVSARSIWSLSQFLILPQPHLKMMLAIKMVKIHLKIIILLPWSKRWNRLYLVLKNTTTSSHSQIAVHSMLSIPSF